MWIHNVAHVWNTVEWLPALFASACSVVSDVRVTLSGIPDNDPPHTIITAHDCGGRNSKAGGTGTYDDPVTFASSPGEYGVCDIVYSPYLKKYLRMEDDCETCRK
ncbi:hypothetical protein F4677DRAFT_413671 [Hypoxylon crocopeplum]|nr:hypothetical protein F4677DRAFT_413671 [Hypoxylon crocopeplum]